MKRRPKNQNEQLNPGPGETFGYALRRKIGDEILDGHLEPGARLDEQNLADRFGVSRTPVREALRQLSDSGLVSIIPRRGAVVTQVDESRLVKLFEVVIEMEAHCARCAAVLMNLIGRSDLQRAHEAGDIALEKGDAEAYSAANRAFHQTIIDGADNEFLARTANLVRVPAAPYRKSQFSLTDRMASSHGEHAAILAAILSRNGDAAYEAMKAHVSNSMLTVLSELRELKRRQNTKSLGVAS